VAVDIALVPELLASSTELLPDVGHSPMLEDPLRTAELLLAFTAIHAAQVD
jgi:pimeloyl-ACP methyl ester carboxylesterase